MNRLTMIITGVAISLLAVTGCGAGSTSGSTSNTSGQAPSQLVNLPRKPVSQIKLVDTSMPGYKIFEGTCANCHGQKGEGGVGPPIYAIGKHWNTTQLTAFVEQGRGGMPARGGLPSDQQVQQVVAWLSKQG